jgi:hypothetical protein
MNVRRGEEGRKINPGTAVPTKRRKYGGKFPYLPSFHFSSQVIEKKLNEPATFDPYATPTPHIPLSLAAATSPAHLVP